MQEDKRKDQRSNSNRRNNGGYKKKKRYAQPPKDSKSKRVNADNEREDKFDRQYTVDTKDRSNDVKWYAHNPEMLKAAGTYGFSYIVGQQLPYGVTKSVPGIMSFSWIPSFGGGNIDALQRAKDAMYSFVVHANSRNKSYDANDLMMTILAGKDVFCILAAMIRAYGVAKKYSEMNRYTPDGLLLAMGFEPKSIKSHLADMWFQINNLIAQATQIWVPANIPLIARQFWMNTNVYTDAAGSKAQFYLYTQDAYYMLDETTFETGTALKMVSLPQNDTADLNTSNLFRPGKEAYDWGVWVTVAQNMIDALTNSEDRGIMFGDVLKAYGKESLYAIGEIPASYTIEYSHDPEVLSQMENLTWDRSYGNTKWIPYFYQTQSLVSSVPSLIAPLYAFTSAGTGESARAINYAPPTNVILNFHQDTTPTPEQIMVATRMMIAGGNAKQVSVIPYSEQSGWKSETSKIASIGTEYALLPDSTGSEICNNVYYWQINGGQSSTPAETSLSYAKTNASCLPMSEISVFDWHPCVYLTTQGQSGDTTRITESSMADDGLGFCMDVDNYTILTGRDLLKLHTAAIYSEFGVPVM